MTTFSENRKARFDYDIIEKFTAGIELLGFEVKAIRAGQISIEGSYVIIRGGEAYLINANIVPLQPKNIENFEPKRNIRILLNKKEISKLADAENHSLTIIPLELYNTGNLIKLSIAIVKGKKRIDKRESIKKRDTDREIRRTLKNS